MLNYSYAKLGTLFCATRYVQILISCAVKICKQYMEIASLLDPVLPFPEPLGYTAK